MQSTRQVFRIVAALASALWLGTAGAQELVVWHDLGDNGTKWFEAMSDEFAKTRPGVTVKAIRLPDRPVVRARRSARSTPTRRPTSSTTTTSA